MTIPDSPPAPRRRVPTLTLASCLLLGLAVVALAFLALRPRDDFAPVRYLQRLGPVSGLPTLPVREAREAGRSKR